MKIENIKVCAFDAYGKVSISIEDGSMKPIEEEETDESNSQD